MSKIVFRVPLLADEQASFGAQFRELDSDELGIVTGEILKEFFSKSGLSSQQLSRVWALVDTEKQGFLNLTQFSAALRAIGHLQATPHAAITPELYQTPAPRLATLTGALAGAIPVVSAHDAGKYGQLFDRSADGRVISGARAKDVFLKAKLPHVVLGSIWTLCDRNNSGSLDRAEFIMAMHLIQLSLSKHPSVATFPPVLPVYLWNSIAAVTPLSSDSTGVSASSASRPVSLARIPSSSFTNASSDWVMTPDKKQQFDSLFDSLDKNRAGALGADILVPFFLTSKLSQDTLATVWDLADIHNSPVFTKTEFAIAMFLIQKKNAGVELPDVVPEQLLASPALGLYHPAGQPRSPQSTSHGGPPAAPSQTYLQPVPSRDTKPHFEQLQQQQTTSSSLTELLGLNSSFNAPPSHIVQSASNANTVSSINASPRQSTSNRSQPANIVNRGINSAENSSRSIPALSPQGTPQNQSMRPPSYISTLPTVPDFTSLQVPEQRAPAKDIYMDSETSGQLSQATTDLANLSNQVSSLTTQVTKTTERKEHAQQELSRINELKASLEAKLTSLHASYQQETQQMEQVEQLLTKSRAETETLTQQLQTTESNYHSIQSELANLQLELQECEKTNTQLKEKISNYNNVIISLQQDLAGKQQQVKQQRALVDVNTQQAELNVATVAGLEEEIKGLDDRLAKLIEKRKELDDYQTNIERQHKDLEEKHLQFVSRSQELENKYLEFSQREKDLQERTKQIVEQEHVYNQQVSRLQQLFKDLNIQRAAFEKAEQDLQECRMEYTQQVQKLSDKQLKLAMRELPEDRSKNASPSENEDAVAKYVEETVTNSKLNVGGPATALDTARVATVLPQDEEGKQDSVFDKDFPTSPSQTELEEEEHPATAETAAQALDESDMNIYRIPRTESVTSSTANNAPQSLRDEAVSDTQGPVADEENERATITKRATANSDDEEQNSTQAASRSLPGEWGDLNYSGNVAEKNNNKLRESISVENSPTPASVDKMTLSVDSTDDSGMEAEKYHSTSDIPTTVLPQRVMSPLVPARNVVVKAVDSISGHTFSFDEEFADLEQASPEDEGTSSKRVSSIEGFETIEHADLEDELHETGFTGAGTAEMLTPSNYSAQTGHPISAQVASSPVGNDEWDEIFSGFGNSSPGLKQPTAQTTMGGSSHANTPQLKSPLNRKIATTPKSLAVEELGSMGFTEQEARKALEKCKWNLEAATNMLLDGS
ncbi:AaceriABR149Wp [[Ashbya] aceris (nom. inval.)]|nr:AaceriABR149Wp [[Ashbya] aceris (nom. inval.)]